MDFNSNPTFKNTLRKAALIVACIMIFEVGLIILLSYYIGFTYVFWITIGFILLGYAIRPSKSAAKQTLSTPFSPRKMASTLFMIPGFLTDFGAILVLIPPIRRLLFAKIMNRLLPGLMGGFNPFSLNMPGANPFAGLDPNQLGGMGMGYPGFGQTDGNPFEAPKKRKRKKRRHHTEDIIDIEPDNAGGDNGDIHAEVIRPATESRAPKALTSDDN